MNAAGDLPTIENEILTVIEPQDAWLRFHFLELWRYRELLFFLVWKEIKVRYKQTLLGASWAVLQPLLTMVIFSVVFGLLAKLPSEGVPYPVFSLVGLLPWQFFSSALSRAGTSLVVNSNLLTKVYFPRLILPLSAVLAGLVDFGISFLVLLVLMIAYGIVPTLAIFFLPLFILFAMLTALAVALWLSALNVQYRDVQYIIPFLVQAWMYASPVAYSIDLIPQGPWRVIYGLNPIAGVIQGFRWALLGASPPDALMWVSLAVTLLILVGGILYFQRMEDSFADVV